MFSISPRSFKIGPPVFKIYASTVMVKSQQELKIKKIYKQKCNDIISLFFLVTF